MTTKQTLETSRFFRPRGRLLGWGSAGLLGLSLALAWISSGYQGVQGWLSFLGVLGLSAGLLWAGWRALAGENPPRRLAGLLLAAALLRLLAGAIWFTALPAGGYGSKTELHGYVMADAYSRDQAAWELAGSGKPLWKAFDGYRRVDQYGGLLFLSALQYRYLGGEAHQPLQMVVLTAAFSGLAVLFTWAFARRMWNPRAAGLAAAGLALYPEAVLLGSSQMREAFTVTLVAAAFYGLAVYIQERATQQSGVQQRARTGLFWVLGALLLSLAFSPPSAALLTGMLAVQALFMSNILRKGQLQQHRRLWLIFGLLAVLILGGLWASWGQIAPDKVTSPWGLVGWWVSKSADWQAHLSQHSSGWIQKIFKGAPEWMQTPFLLSYGVMKPFLPAALADITSAPLWRAIAIWRALGWALVLPLLLYAPLLAVRSLCGRKPLQLGAASGALGLSIIVWTGILVASFRAGGDDWDNSRYRAMFAGLQLALAAWVLVQQSRSRDPWMRRVLISAALVFLWFVPWYLERYIHLLWPVTDPFLTLGLGFASAFLYVLWDWMRFKKASSGGGEDALP